MTLADKEIAPEESEVIHKEDLADWPVQSEEFDECTEEVEIPQNSTLEQEEFFMEAFLPEKEPDGFDPYSPWDDEDAPRPSGNPTAVNASFIEEDPLSSFIRQEVSSRLDFAFIWILTNVSCLSAKSRWATDLFIQKTDKSIKFVLKNKSKETKIKI